MAVLYIKLDIALHCHYQAPPQNVKLLKGEHSKKIIISLVPLGIIYDGKIVAKASLPHF